MNFSDADKQAIINEQARIFTKVTLLSTGDVFTEDDSLSSWDYEDFRYVPNQGFIGQFVERLMDISLKGVEINSTLVDQEINVQIGVDNKNTNELTYYDMGNFIVTKVGDVDTTGNITVESADYTKKFNVEYDARKNTFPILAGHLANDICEQVGVELEEYKNVLYYIHNSDTPLSIGTYSMPGSDKLYTFTTTQVLNKNDVLILTLGADKIVQKTINQTTYEITRTKLDYETSDFIYADGDDVIIDNTSANKKISKINIYGRTIQHNDNLSNISTISGDLDISIVGTGGTITVQLSLDDDELCSMPDYLLYENENIFYNNTSDDDNIILYAEHARDVLTIDFISGIITKTSYIGKIDNYDGEEINGPFISSTGALTTGATVYYLLDEPVIKEESIDSHTPLSLATSEVEITNNQDAEMNVEIVTFDDSSYNFGTGIADITAKSGDFTNDDFVIEKWPYTALDTARKAMSDIGKLAYSWIRVAEDNKVHIDFNNMDMGDVDQYDRITIDDYYELTTEPKYIGPINRVSLGISNVNGEEMYKDAPNITGEINELEISDNELTLTDELRQIALNGCEKLFGLTYIPLKVSTIGHPWLKGDEMIAVQNLDDDYVYTYPFDRLLSYKGFIKSEIASDGKNKVQSTYEFKSDTLTSIKNAEINVNKATGQIELLTSEVYPNGIESDSAIKMNSDAIDLEVNVNRDAAISGAIDTYNTETVQAGLSLKYDKADANAAVVLKAKSNGSLVTAALTADPSTGSAFTVKADDIDLTGKNINLTSNNITITSTKFNVDKNGNMTCNDATINGNLVTANGVLSNLIFPCEHWGWDQENAYNGVGGWFMGFNYLFDNSYNPYAIKSFINFCINIPANFTVTSAKIYLRHTPTEWYTGATDFSSTVQYEVGDCCIYNNYVYRCTTRHKGSWNSSHFTQVAAAHITGYCRNVKIYKATGLGQTAEAGYYSEYTIGGTTPVLSQITTDNFTFSSSAFEQKATSDFASTFTASSSSQTYNIVVSTDVSTPSITSIDTAYNDIGKYTGLMTGYAQIIGYLKTS